MKFSHCTGTNYIQHITHKTNHEDYISCEIWDLDGSSKNFLQSNKLKKIK